MAVLVVAGLIEDAALVEIEATAVAPLHGDDVASAREDPPRPGARGLADGGGLPALSPSRAAS